MNHDPRIPHNRWPRKSLHPQDLLLAAPSHKTRKKRSLRNRMNTVCMVEPPSTASIPSPTPAAKLTEQREAFRYWHATEFVQFIQRKPEIGQTLNEISFCVPGACGMRSIHSAIF